MYENKPFSTKIQLFYVKVAHFAMLLHPCTETDVQSSK